VVSMPSTSASRKRLSPAKRVTFCGIKPSFLGFFSEEKQKTAKA
jgi:hypothetical protein